MTTEQKNIDAAKNLSLDIYKVLPGRSRWHYCGSAREGFIFFFSSSALVGIGLEPLHAVVQRLRCLLGERET